ncbi:MAG: hypothetical protein MZV70_01535 [Desulfobacterales bacterium]|nr:hypothetical protein [Desulfobacterales bacterium]
MFIGNMPNLEEYLENLEQYNTLQNSNKFLLSNIPSNNANLKLLEYKSRKIGAKLILKPVNYNRLKNIIEQYIEHDFADY